LYRALAVACTLAIASPAAAQSSPDDIGPSYLIDGGAIPFIWVPLFVNLATYKVGPDSEPRLFSSSEGGASVEEETIPGVYTSIATGTTFIGLLAYPGDGRWYHVKGFAQATSMAGTTTNLLKKFFGRQRPSYDPSDRSENERKSFPSGHATSALRITSYTALYLRRHVFAEMRGDAFISWPEAIAYPALAALAVYVPYTRVMDHRHHVSDVLAGAAFGLTYTSIFFWYQESRLKDHQRKEESAVLSPWGSGRGLSVGWAY
jgi:membrane-associated phospholipid phosphatase